MTKDSVMWFKIKIKEAGYSQRTLAKELGINQAIISHMFCGTREMKAKEVRTWAKILKVSSDDILAKVDAVGEQYVPTDEIHHGLVSKRFHVDERSLDYILS